MHILVLTSVTGLKRLFTASADQNGAVEAAEQVARDAVDEPMQSRDELQHKVQVLMQRLADSGLREYQLIGHQRELKHKLQEREQLLEKREQQITQKQDYLESRMLFLLSVYLSVSLSVCLSTDMLWTLCQK